MVAPPWDVKDGDVSAHLPFANQLRSSTATSESLPYVCIEPAGRASSSFHASDKAARQLAPVGVSAYHAGGLSQRRCPANAAAKSTPPPPALSAAASAHLERQPPQSPAMRVMELADVQPCLLTPFTRHAHDSLAPQLRGCGLGRRGQHHSLGYSSSPARRIDLSRSRRASTMACQRVRRSAFSVMMPTVNSGPRSRRRRRAAAVGNPSSGRAHPEMYCLLRS